jgi:NAD(P)H-dependent FMN reductase
VEGDVYMKIAIIVGSLRKESYNRKIAEFMKGKYSKDHEIELLRLNDLPLFNEDIEKDPPSAVKDFKNSIKNSDAVIIVSPEYNHSIPGGMKNALDWCSRVERVFLDKPVLVMGASNGNVGTARGQSHLKQVLNAPGLAAMVLPGNHLLVPNVQERFDEDGTFTDEKTIGYLDKVVDNLVEWTDKMK